MDTTTTTRRPDRAVVRWVRSYPLTTVLSLLVLLVSLAAWALRVRPGGPLHLDALAPFAIVAVSNGALALVTTLAGVVVLVSVSERLMGWRRSLLAFVVTTVAATEVGALLALLDVDQRQPLRVFLSHALAFDPWSAVVGTIATASAFAGALWRRRIRVVVVAVVVTLLLYSGHTADLFAALAAAMGVGLGELLRRSPRRTGWVRSSHREARVLLSSVVLVSALGPLVALVSRGRVGLLAPVAAVLTNGSISGTPACSVRDVTEQCVEGLRQFHANGPFGIVLGVAPLALLAVAGFGLRRGSRLSLWTVVGVDVATGIAAATFFGIRPGAAVSDIDARPASDHVAVTLSLVASVLVPFATALLLVLRRRDFQERARRPRAAVFVGVAAGIAVLLGAGVWVVSVVDGTVAAHPLRLALAVLGPLTPAIAEAAVHAPPTMRVALAVADPIGWFVVAGTLLWATNTAVSGRLDIGLDERRLTRELVHAGGDTFAWMTTWAGNESWFTPDRRAGIAYRRTGHVAVTLGGPFGHEDARAGVVDGFARFCDDRGWTPVFYAVRPTVVDGLLRQGWSQLPVAEDADLDPSTWTTSGKRKQDIRTAVNKAGRQGVRTLWGAWQDLPTAITRQAVAISEEWVSERDLPEMGFTLGGVDEMRDPEVRTLVAVDQADTVLAVTSWLPSFREGELVGWTLDVMRRGPDAPNGTMEFLVADCVARAREDGLERVGLSATPLAHSTPHAEGPATLLQLVGDLLEPVYGFRSLLRFKTKFGPELQPLVMVYPDPVALPAIGVAIVRAYLPELSARQALSFLRQSGARDEREAPVPA